MLLCSQAMAERISIRDAPPRKRARAGPSGETGLDTIVCDRDVAQQERVRERLRGLREALACAFHQGPAHPPERGGSKWGATLSWIERSRVLSSPISAIGSQRSIRRASGI